MGFATLNAVQQALHGLLIVERELLLFAAFWFVVGALDELGVDLAWLWLRLTGRLRHVRIEPRLAEQALSGRMAVLVPAWQESAVIGAMISHTLRVWQQQSLVLYVGCYRNDAETLAAAIRAAGGDRRLRLVIHDVAGPTTKADCLNRLYAALCEDERRLGLAFAGIVLHDSEDMVHPAALAALDRMLAHVEFAQLPVRPETLASRRWISGHYADEFAEAHAKTMVVRDAIGAALPAAGVGCAFARSTLARLAGVRARSGEAGPFATDCLTEDYELGLLIARGGGRCRFVRLWDEDDNLIATRSFFPARLDEAVRQKSRWIHGIALQGWERLGWVYRPVELWMALRDRRGPLTALVLAVAYGLLVVEAVLAVARLAGWHETEALSAPLRIMLGICFASFVWRAVWRFGFVASEYGLGEGLRAVVRIPLANVIAIMAGRRAFQAYLRVLRGEVIQWDKTSHDVHPAGEIPVVATGPVAAIWRRGLAS